MAAMKERDMFNETFRRQAEIDSGYRTITASDDQFSFRYLMVENSFYDYAMAKIESDVERENLHNIFLEYWTGRVQSRFGNGFLTEFSVREEITGLDHFLEASDALYHTIDTFRGEVIRWHHLDEMSFDFQPNDRDPHSDSAPGLTQDSERAIGFRQWAAQYERQMGRRVKPAFSRWYILLGAYKAYLIQTAPAQYTRFNEIRDSIAANSFRNLLERFRLEDINVEMGPELEPSAPEPSEEEELSLLQWLGEDWSGLLEGEELDDLLQWLGEDWDGQLP
ncbi:hypothetical protein EYC84_007915 [Monilinia fructicola]|uniref:Uncharacterized protein n=1 Tax=Monilinia fructicola TaxID=38448 RepID=A0A5M9JLR4_MONFR|nr:hypothetical protein EYC84_007915 [Monilinia fructicola]